MSELATQPIDGAQSLIRAAMDPNVDAEKMERLFALHERWQEREAQQQYAEAMNACQQAIPPIKRTETNSQTGTKYAPLEELMEVIHPIYINNGFAISYSEGDSTKPNHMRVMAKVSHRGGHSETFFLDAEPDMYGIKGSQNKTMVQGMGSTVSYCRRYLTAMIFNVTFAGEDDDGRTTGDNPRVFGGRAPDNSFQPPLDYALRVLSPTIEHIIQAVRDEDYSSALEAYNELTKGEQMALKVAPSKGGPWPQDVWNSMQARGAFRLYAEEQARIRRAEQQVNAHEAEE